MTSGADASTPRPRRFKPAPPFIILHNGAISLFLIGVMALVALLDLAALAPSAAARLVLILLAGLLLLLVWNTLVWLAETFTLAEDRAVWESGVFHRLRVEVPFRRVQNVVLSRSLPERLFGVGTLALATAGTDGYELVWRSVARPRALLDEVRSAVDHAQPAMPSPSSPPPPTGWSSLPAPPVIGLAGGIGSGKSTVARILADLGCLVIDSDERARAALDRPEVRDQLVAWWGPDILTDGRVNRGKVAQIVFSDPDQRQRLESLVHPIVRQDRAAMIAEAGPGHRAVVIDAPLLFEAGLDRECDAIIFVDTPREQRLARTQANRGWDEAELARREAAQMPPEEKRRRADHVIPNAGSLEDLAAATGAVLERIEASLAGRDAGRPGVPQAASGGG